MNGDAKDKVTQRDSSLEPKWPRRVVAVVVVVAVAVVVVAVVVVVVV